MKSIDQTKALNFARTWSKRVTKMALTHALGPDPGNAQIVQYCLTFEQSTFHPFSEDQQARLIAFFDPSRANKTVFRDFPTTALYFFASSIRQALEQRVIDVLTADNSIAYTKRTATLTNICAALQTRSVPTPKDRLFRSPQKMTHHEFIKQVDRFATEQLKSITVTKKPRAPFDPLRARERRQEKRAVEKAQQLKTAEAEIRKFFGA